ncbi:cysteine-rich receptor-like protein kinase 6 isoform X4 [Triticum aestivum]|uniref:cysteine-rich receptor-like protein kinase 6 isoform X4 n=1 Tax=Triticum aestivum TaxID=4565 RepID=UPI001D002D87|nr:cysteine-rich receptor-like protein kinase 6 isoform X4 [Triticum aestivum]
MIVLALLLAYLLPFGDADPLGHLCGGVTGGDYTAQSTYGANLELLPAALRKNASSGLFTKGSVGAAPHTVYGLGLCRGDASACGDCIGAAFGDVQQLCPLNRDARALHEKCVLSYSSHDFASYGSNATESLLVVVWPDDVKVKPMHPGNGESVVSEMIDEIAMMAAYSLTTARYATGRVDVNSTGAPPASIYSLAQCNQDLPPDDCRDCLDGIKKMFVGTYSSSSSVVSRQGAWVVGVWCNFRYGTHQFYQRQPMYMKSIGSSGVG